MILVVDFTRKKKLFPFACFVHTFNDNLPHEKNHCVLMTSSDRLFLIQIIQLMPFQFINTMTKKRPKEND